MTADVESMMYTAARGVPWHGLGTEVDGLQTAGAALVAAGLDWNVNKVGIQTIDGTLIPDRFATVRDRDGEAFGVVGRGYTVIQNADAFAFADAIVDDGSAKYETAGSLRGGRTVFLSMELPKHVKVAGDDSAIDTYLMLTNTHDGWAAMQAVITPVRVVCANTLAQALHGARNRFSIRHTKNATERVGAAREALRLSFAYLDTFEKIANDLARKPISEKDARRILAKVFPLPVDADDEQRERSPFARALANWKTSETIDDAMRATGWGLYNAVAEYVDHGIRYQKADRRAWAILMGGAAEKAKKETVALLTR
jgi:phage/plasmid-like protein (TIGR03299 family)